MLPDKLKFLQTRGSCDALLWDFDGVILDSMRVRESAFRFVLRAYPSSHVDQLVAWHKANGGLSRYVKFARFQENILEIDKDEAQIAVWATEFSKYCSDRLADSSFLIGRTIRALPELAVNCPMHIVSGSDEVELRALCKALDVSKYFVSIHGSPTAKTELVRNVIDKHGYNPHRCWLIGDSINDFDAAKANKLHFIGFKETQLAECSDIFWE